jgi:hypothetical protein
MTASIVHVTPSSANPTGVTNLTPGVTTLVGGVPRFAVLAATAVAGFGTVVSCLDDATRSRVQFATFGAATPLMRVMDPETAHNVGIALLSAGIAPQETRPDPPQLAIERWGLRFPNPVGLAAGFDKAGPPAHVDSPSPIAARSLVPRWFQPLHLSSEKAVSKSAFQIRLAPLQRGRQGVSSAHRHGFRIRGDWLRHAPAAARQPQAAGRIVTPGCQIGLHGPDHAGCHQLHRNLF